MGTAVQGGGSVMNRGEVGRTRRLTRACLVAAVALLVMSGCGGGGSVGEGAPGAQGTRPTKAAQPGPSVTARSAVVPRPPEHGVLVGAWVRPTDFSDAGRVQAFEDFEQMVGRRLDIAHVFNTWDEPFPTTSDRSFASSGRTLLISWAGTESSVIVSGAEDQLIRARARDIAALEVPVLLRWRWEMDRPNLRDVTGTPQEYIAAWKHIRGIFAEEKVTNVGWVWCPHAQGFMDATRNAAAYYPGDDQVDWLCADVYAEPRGATFAAAVGPFLEWAADRPQPIIIGEFGVQRGDRGKWLRDAWEAVRQDPRIKGLVYFDGENKADNGFDHRLARTPDAVAAFREMLREPYFDPLGHG